jgi:hypothetical protein
MRPGIVASSEGESSSSVCIHGGLLHKFGGVMLTVMYRVTGCVDRVASSTSFLRTQGISAREMFSWLNERESSTKRTTLRA